MKRLRVILRFFLAAVFLSVAGGVAFNYLQPPQPPLEAQEFLITLTSAGYIWPTISLVFLVAAIFLLFKRTIGLGLLVPIPILFNLFLYHLFLDPSLLNAAPGLVLICLHITCLVLYRQRFGSLVSKS